MTVWLTDVRDPLIFGDGRPFSAIPGTRVRSLLFPHPSTVAGAVRTVSGRDQDGRFDKTKIPVLVGKGIRGPLLVEVGMDDAVAHWLLPAPADALLLKTDSESKGRRLWVCPLDAPADAKTNIGDGLRLVGPQREVKDKPHGKPPRYWWRSVYEHWLQDPTDDVNAIELQDLGHSGPTREHRMHVSIAPKSQTAVEGALFGTSGLEFVHGRREGSGLPELSTVRRLAFVVDTDAELREEWGFLGGERRVVRWRPIQEDLPSCPSAVHEGITQSRHCRLLMATPGLFDRGYLPTWVLTRTPGVQVTIVGAAVPRYQTVSGWDYAARPQRPKPTRRLVPAGSVYFLKLDGDTQAISEFIKATWMENISDDAQDRLDGFGLALLGVWDGNLTPFNFEVNV